ncbi:hypothetical protein EJB05_10820, partial [Eragrostis curvula]
MAPKARPAEEAEPKERSILGVFSSHLKVALVGLPCAGKSTLFKILSEEIQIPDEYIPTKGVEVDNVKVPDRHIALISQLYEKNVQVAPFFEIRDTPGIGLGSHIGEISGNEFLDEIRTVDGIFYVLRALKEDNMPHIYGTVNPTRDLKFLQLELQIKDAHILENRIKELEHKMGLKSDKKLILEYELCIRLQAHVQSGKDVRFGKWNPAEISIFNQYNLLTAKPVVYLVNISAEDMRRRKNKFVTEIWNLVEVQDKVRIVPFSCAFERQLLSLTGDEATQYCRDEKLESKIPKLIEKVFEANGVIFFYTFNSDEVKWWQIRCKTKTLDAAYAVDKCKRAFVRIKVIKYEDLLASGAKLAFKDVGNLYEIKDGDIVDFGA